MQHSLCVPKSYTAGHCFVFKLRYGHINTVVQSARKTTVGARMKTRAKPLLAIFAVWKCWSENQAISLFWCFCSYCVAYYWSWSKGWFPGNMLTFQWCCTFAHQFCFLHDLSKQCGNRTAAGMKDINIDANVIKRWLNFGGGTRLCVVSSLFGNTRNEYIITQVFIQRRTLSVVRVPNLSNPNPVIVLTVTVMCMMSWSPSEHLQQMLDTFLFFNMCWWCDKAGV